MDTCYGVTDHHIIVPLKVIKRTTVEDFVKIETEIVGVSNNYMECHHNHYFKEMWLDEDGLPDKGNVFVNKSNAIAYALKKANEEIETKQAAVDYIKEQVVKLNEENEWTMDIADIEILRQESDAN